jgi:hypothetical protein
MQSPKAYVNQADRDRAIAILRKTGCLKNYEIQILMILKGFCEKFSNYAADLKIDMRINLMTRAKMIYKECAKQREG